MPRNSAVGTRTGPLTREVDTLYGDLFKGGGQGSGPGAKPAARPAGKPPVQKPAAKPVRKTVPGPRSQAPASPLAAAPGPFDNLLQTDISRMEQKARAGGRPERITDLPLGERHPAAALMKPPTPAMRMQTAQANAERQAEQNAVDLRTLQPRNRKVGNLERVGDALRRGVFGTSSHVDELVDHTLDALGQQGRIHLTLAPAGTPARRQEEAALARLRPLVEEYDRRLDQRAVDAVARLPYEPPSPPTTPGTSEYAQAEQRKAQRQVQQYRNRYRLQVQGRYAEQAQGWNEKDFAAFLREKGIDPAKLGPHERLMLAPIFDAKKVEWTFRPAKNAAVGGDVLLNVNAALMGEIASPLLAPVFGAFGKLAPAALRAKLDKLAQRPVGQFLGKVLKPEAMARDVATGAAQQGMVRAATDPGAGLAGVLESAAVGGLAGALAGPVVRGAVGGVGALGRAVLPRVAAELPAGGGVVEAPRASVGGSGGTAPKPGAGGPFDLARAGREVRYLFQRGPNWLRGFGPGAESFATDVERISVQAQNRVPRALEKLKGIVGDTTADERAQALAEVAGIRQGADGGPAKPLAPHVQRFAEDYRDWLDETGLQPSDLRGDPLKALEGAGEKVFAGRLAREVWGEDLENVDAFLKGLNVAESEKKRLAMFLRGVVGQDSAWAPPEQPAGLGGKVAQAAGNYETLSKLGFRPLSALRNYFQRYTNSGVQYGIKPVLRAQVELLTPWRQASRDVMQAIERSGALGSETAAGETAGKGNPLMDGAMALFRRVERGNTYTAARVRQLGLQQDLDALAKLGSGETLTGLDRIKKLFALGSDTPDAIYRRLEKSGLKPEDVMERLRENSSLTLDEIEEAMLRATQDEQFASTLASNPAWWDSSPWLRLAGKFKPFAVKQTAFLWNDVAKEALQGNRAPLARYLWFTLLAGEAYNAAKDAATGSKNAVSSHLRDSADQQRRQLALRLWDNFKQGGGLGLLTDLVYGDDWTEKAQDLLGGPAAGTVRNVAKAGKRIVTNPQAADLALKDLARAEVGAVRDVEAFSRNVKPRPGDVRKELVGVQQLIRENGPKVKVEPHPESRGYLVYSESARALAENDLEAAARNLRRVLRGVKGSDLSGAFYGIEAALRARGPQGSLDQKQWGDTMRRLTPDQVRQAMALRQDWERRIEEVMRETRRWSVSPEGLRFRGVR